MNFSSALKVSDTIHASDEVRQIRGENRARINNAANGAPPLDENSSKKLGMEVNVNWNELAVKLQDARRQYRTAFFQKGRFFKVGLPLAPEKQKTDWETFITQTINKKMNDSLDYFELSESKFAAVVCHGIGPQVWFDSEEWLPSGCAIEDLIVPTDTELSFRKWQWFAVRVPYTEGMLAEKCFGPYARKGWNKPAIQAILDKYHDENYDENADWDWIQTPEKMYELIKQNQAFFSSDAVPTIPLFHFYFKDANDKKKTGWRMRVVADTGVKGVGDEDDKFLFDDGDKFVADKIQHLIHVQYGDLNNKSPFLFHSVRSLGFLLMEPCFWTNLFRCRMLQHGFETFNIWLRFSDPNSRARAQAFNMFNKAAIPEGVSIVPQTERHQVQAGLIEAIQADLKQVIGEVSSSYTQNTDNGTQKEKTAHEVVAEIQQVNAMVSGMMSTAFIREKFAYIEICRRFCIRKSHDEDVIEFQKSCREYGIPQVYINSEQWDIQVEIPLGGGNPTLEQVQANQLMQNRPAFDTTAQQEILHQWVTAITGDPKKAESWVPINKKRGITDAQEWAQFAFGALMQGVPITPKEGLSPVDQIETLMIMLSEKVQKIVQTGGMTDMNTLQGLENTMSFIGNIIKQISEDPAMKQRVKKYSDYLGKIANECKGFAQRLSEKMKSEGPNAEGQAKLQIQAQEAKQKMAIKQAEAQQAMHLKQIGFMLDQKLKAHAMQLKTATTVADQHLKTATAVTEEHRKNATTSADIKRKSKMTAFKE